MYANKNIYAMFAVKIVFIYIRRVKLTWKLNYMQYNEGQQCCITLSMPQLKEEERNDRRPHAMGANSQS